MTLRTNSHLLTFSSLLVVGVWATSVKTGSRQHCHEVKPCAWVSKGIDQRHHGTVHVISPCRRVGASCVYDSTCPVKDGEGDIYVCKTKQEESALKRDRTGSRAMRRRKLRGTSSDAHARAKRAAIDTESKPVLGKNTKRKSSMPAVWEKIMQRHRAFNANAFNHGTYVLNNGNNDGGYQAAIHTKHPAPT